MEQPNEFMTWEEMKRRYPSKWVVVDKKELLSMLLLMMRLMIFGVSV